jgi:hypothetical protein
VKSVLGCAFIIYKLLQGFLGLRIIKSSHVYVLVLVDDSGERERSGGGGACSSLVWLNFIFFMPHHSAFKTEVLKFK